MQAIILADVQVNNINELKNNNLKCMTEINGVTLIERMLKQLDSYNLDRIVIVDGYLNNLLEQFISTLSLNTPIQYIYNDKYLETGNIYSIYLAKYFLCETDFLIIDSNLMLDDQIITDLIKDNRDTIAVIDQYKSWMTGKTVEMNDKKEIIGFQRNNEINHLTLKNSFKTVGIYKFSAQYFKKYFLPYLETYLKVAGKKESIEIIIDILNIALNLKVNSYFIKCNRWYAINDIQDIDLASTLFSEDEELVTEKMFGSWGGYWRYPKYLDYFYLVTPYYPTKELVEELKANFEDLLFQYPSGMKVNSLLAAKEFNVKQENIIIGNGAAELIKSIMTTITGRTGFIKPTFEEYPNRLTKEEHVDFYVTSDDFTYNAEDIIHYFKDKEIKNLILVNPENPSGNYINKKSMRKLLEWTKEQDIKLIIDESFVDFVDEEDPTLIKQDILDEFKNLYVIKSISKSYGVPGLRLGILASADSMTIAWMKKDVSIWNINSFAEFYMQIASKYHKDYENALARFREERISFQNALADIDWIRVIPSQSNYIMVELVNGIEAEWLKQKMLIDEKIFIKTLGKKIKNGKNYLRLAIRDHSDNTRFIEALKRVLTNYN